MTQVFRIRPVGQQSILDLGELQQFRHFFYVLVWRALKVRYKQTAIGIAWVVLQPILLTFTFTIIFGLLASMPSDGQPYPIFVLSGLVVWTFVAQAFNSSSASLIVNAPLITRIYFPRVILIFTAITASLVDFLCAFLLLIVMMFWYGIAPTIGALVFVPMLLLAIMTIFGLSLWMSALYVPYRDVGQVLPFLVQLWMFLSPVIYPSTLLPPKYQFVYALNPIVVVIDTSRWAFSGGPPPQSWMVMVSCGVALLLCVTGYWFFRRQEATFADII